MLPLPFLVPHSPCIPEGPGLTWVVRDSPGKRRLWSYVRSEEEPVMQRSGKREFRAEGIARAKVTRGTDA